MHLQPTSSYAISSLNSRPSSQSISERNVESAGAHSCRMSAEGPFVITSRGGRGGGERICMNVTEQKC